MRKFIIVGIAAACVAFGTSALAQTCSDVHATAAGDGCAPSLIDGSTVTVTGVVYVAPGTYNSGSTYFQCGDGGLIFFESGGPYAIGDEIEVTGTVGAFNSEIQLGSTTVVINSAGNPTTPATMTTADLGAGGEFLGDFVEIEGTLVSKDTSGFNDIYTVDDGSGPARMYVDGSTGINEGVIDANIGGVIRVRGASRCPGEVLPRMDSDIVIVSEPPPPPPPPTVTCLEAHATDAGDGCAPSLLEGETVTMSGVVYVAAGTFNSGSVYFQCGDGGGMTFFQFGAPYAVGDEIEVVGTIGDFQGEIQLNGAMVTVLSDGNATAAEPLGTGALAAGGDFIGAFGEIQGVLVSKEFGGFNAGYTVDDGTGPVTVFVDGTTGMDQERMDSFLGHVVRISGATKCFRGLLEILPRNDDDVVPVQVGLDIRPEGCPNSLGAASEGLLTAAILGSETLDVSSIDVSTLELAGVPVGHTGTEILESETAASCDCATVSNAHPDLTAKFDAQTVLEALQPVWKDEEREVILIGRLLDGSLFSASDCVTLRGMLPDLVPERGSEISFNIKRGADPSVHQISYMLDQDQDVDLAVYDVAGRLVSRLFRGRQARGGYDVNWDSRSQAAGIYFVRLKRNDQVTSKRVMVID